MNAAAAVKSHEQGDKTSRTSAAARAARVALAPAAADGLSLTLDVRRAVGNMAVQRLLRAGALQAKRTANAPGDLYGRGADACAGHAVSSAAGAQTATFGRGGGQPLSPSLRAFFEPRFLRDFGDVRVHTDPEATEAAERIHAQAFTHGRDIYFGAGRFQPHSREGRRLLAHELTHVIQQGGRTAAAGGEDVVAGKADGETKATGEGERGPSAPRPAISARHSPAVQRDAEFATGAVLSARNAAEQIVSGGYMGITHSFLNGMLINSEKTAQASISPAVIAGRPTDKGTECWVEQLPKNVASTMEIVLTEGPWTAQTTKQRMGLLFPWLDDCAEGDPKEAAQLTVNDPQGAAAANRTHEDTHALFEEVAFALTVGEWDQLLGHARDSRRVAVGSDLSTCEMALYTSVGGTPKEVASRLWYMADTMHRNFHLSPEGQPLKTTDVDSDWGCDKVTANLVQAKPTVGQPGDSYEQEADRVADAVMNMPDAGGAGRAGDLGQAAGTPPPQQHVPGELIQRQPAAYRDPGLPWPSKKNPTQHYVTNKGAVTQDWLEAQGYKWVRTEQIKKRPPHFMEHWRHPETGDEVFRFVSARTSDEEPGKSGGAHPAVIELRKQFDTLETTFEQLQDSYEELVGKVGTDEYIEHWCKVEKSKVSFGQRMADVAIQYQDRLTEFGDDPRTKKSLVDEMVSRIPFLQEVGSLAAWDELAPAPPGGWTLCDWYKGPAPEEGAQEETPEEE